MHEALRIVDADKNRRDEERYGMLPRTQIFS